MPMIFCFTNALINLLVPIKNKVKRTFATLYYNHFFKKVNTYQIFHTAKALTFKKAQDMV